MPTPRDLAAEKERLDAYRAKLVKTAKKLQAPGLAGGGTLLPRAAPSPRGRHASRRRRSRRRPVPARKPRQPKPSGRSPARQAPGGQARAPAGRGAPPRTSSTARRAKPQSNTKSS